MTSVFAAGHWRRRDPLEGLTEPMRAVIADAQWDDLVLVAGVYRRVDGRGGAHLPASIRALADRGLLRFHAGPRGDKRVYRLTRSGGDCAAEIRRRADARIKLTRMA